MKLSQLVNIPLRRFGVKLVRLSSLHKLQTLSYTGNISDIKEDVRFMKLYNAVCDYTMTGIERAYSLYKALEYLFEKKIAGDMVECGVWKGGSCMLMAYFFKSRGETHRRIFLYDTFEGMVQPGPVDGEFEKNEWNRLKMDEQKNSWCLSSLEEVQANMQKTGYPAENIVYVKGAVENTIPATVPSEIALLRLDTDWYESTRHELEHLFPLLSDRGILLIDDYGVWQGAKKATDEYLKNLPYHLQRIDNSGRLLIKA
jgi:O-methyltransferase